MQSHRELLARKEELERQIASAREAEYDNALKTLKALIAEFDFTAQQLFPWTPEKTKVLAKYYDPSTGSKWSGRGKPPKWIQGKDYSQFLVKRD